MKIIVGCDLSTFKEYYKNCGRGDLGAIEEIILTDDHSHCILWIKGQEILGHALWHECSTSEHRPGNPRDENDRNILESMFGQNEHLIELHELWLKVQFRGKGYGKKFFEFFEEFIMNKGFKNIIYYTDHPAARAICRNRNYKEAFIDEYKWYVFGKTIN